VLLLLPLGFSFSKLGQLFEGALDGPICIVGVRDRRAPQRHDGIAHELVECAPCSKTLSPSP